MIQQSSLKSTFRSDPGADVQQPDAGHHLRRRRPHVRALQRAGRFPAGEWPTYSEEQVKSFQLTQSSLGLVQQAAQLVILLWRLYQTGVPTEKIPNY